MEFNRFPSIDGFHKVRKNVQKYGWCPQPLTYRAKIKLHGSNAGVRLLNGQVLAQSRDRLITPQQDHLEFAAWVEEQRGYFSALSGDLTLFGEWCGQRIMKGTSISRIGRRIYAIFAAQPGNSRAADVEILLDPSAIEKLLPGPHPDIFVLPWYGAGIEIDFNEASSLEGFVNRVNRMVEEVEECDPWVKREFDVEGSGEGLVFYPGGRVARDEFKRLTFKAKGEKHRVVKQRKAVQIDPEVAASVEQFVEKTLTQARLEQAASSVNGGQAGFDQKLIGPFLAWLGRDVKKETPEELEASGLEWRQVAKPVMRRAREWYFEQLGSSR